MRRLHLRPERHIIAAVLPGVGYPGQQVFHVEVLIIRNSQPFQIQVDPAGLLLRGIQVDCDQNSPPDPSGADFE
jgi:hypothetical protein